MFVGIVTIGVLGLITSVLFQEIENKVIPWKTDVDRAPHQMKHQVKRKWAPRHATAPISLARR